MKAIRRLAGRDLGLEKLKNRALLFEERKKESMWPVLVLIRAEKWFIRLVGRRLCSIVLWMDRRHIHEDEFHHTLDMNGLLTTWMTAEEYDEYLTDLPRRRDIAHRRDFEKVEGHNPS